jgi:hypothetical protein
LIQKIITNINKPKEEKAMAMIPAKCPRCGKNITVDDTKKAGLCEYCDAPFLTEILLDKSSNSRQPAKTASTSTAATSAKREPSKWEKILEKRQDELAREAQAKKPTFFGKIFGKPEKRQAPVTIPSKETKKSTPATVKTASGVVHTVKNDNNDAYDAVFEHILKAFFEFRDKHSQKIVSLQIFPSKMHQEDVAFDISFVFEGNVRRYNTNEAREMLEYFDVVEDDGSFQTLTCIHNTFESSSSHAYKDKKIKECVKHFMKNNPNRDFNLSKTGAEIRYW